MAISPKGGRASSSWGATALPDHSKQDSRRLNGHALLWACLCSPFRVRRLSKKKVVNLRHRRRTTRLCMHSTAFSAFAWYDHAWGSWPAEAQLPSGGLLSADLWTYSVREFYGSFGLLEFGSLTAPKIALPTRHPLFSGGNRHDSCRNGLTRRLLPALREDRVVGQNSCSKNDYDGQVIFCRPTLSFPPRTLRSTPHVACASVATKPYARNPEP